VRQNVTVFMHAITYTEREEGMGTRRVWMCSVITCVLIGLLAWGCGEEKTPPPSQHTNALASTRIRAADGGTVTVPSPHPLAGTSTAIPPGAIDADTTMSIFAAPLPAQPGVGDWLLTSSLMGRLSMCLCG